MSLIDTIKGAREEAEQAGSLIGNRKADEAAGEKTTATSQSYARKTAANAKPVREKAGSIKTASSDGKMTKEEKKAAREKRRSDEDLAYDAKRAALDMMPGYQRTQRIWWGLLISGMVCTVIAWGALRGVSAENAGNSGIAIATSVMMVLAYVLVIGAFIYDIVKVRPMRNEADKKVSSMTKKRMQKVIDENEERKAAEKAAKGKK